MPSTRREQRAPEKILRKGRQLYIRLKLRSQTTSRAGTSERARNRMGGTWADETSATGENREWLAGMREERATKCPRGCCGSAAADTRPCASLSNIGRMQTPSHASSPVREDSRVLKVLERAQRARRCKARAAPSGPFGEQPEMPAAGMSSETKGG